jgi:DNA-binding Lrp family transcriptional regulator
MEMTLGEYDLSISLTCRDTEHLTSVLNDEIRAIPGVEAIYATLVLEVLKDVYDWAPED